MRSLLLLGALLLACSSVEAFGEKAIKKQHIPLDEAVFDSGGIELDEDKTPQQAPEPSSVQTQEPLDQDITPHIKPEVDPVQDSSKQEQLYMSDQKIDPSKQEVVEEDLNISHAPTHEKLHVKYPSHPDHKESEIKEGSRQRSETASVHFHGSPGMQNSSPDENGVLSKETSEHKSEEKSESKDAENEKLSSSATSNSETNEIGKETSVYSDSKNVVGNNAITKSEVKTKQGDVMDVKLNISAEHPYDRLSTSENSRHSANSTSLESSGTKDSKRDMLGGRKEEISRKSIKIDQNSTKLEKIDYIVNASAVISNVTVKDNESSDVEKKNKKSQDDMHTSAIEREKATVKVIDKKLTIGKAPNNTIIQQTNEENKNKEVKKDVKEGPKARIHPPSFDYETPWRMLDDLEGIEGTSTKSQKKQHKKKTSVPPLTVLSPAPAYSTETVRAHSKHSRKKGDGDSDLPEYDISRERINNDGGKSGTDSGNEAKVYTKSNQKSSNILGWGVKIEGSDFVSSVKVIGLICLGSCLIGAVIGPPLSRMMTKLYSMFKDEDPFKGRYEGLPTDEILQEVDEDEDYLA